MSFAGDVKKEIARQLPDDYHCLLAEIAAMIHYAGTISGSAEHGTIRIETGNVVLAKKYLRLIKKAFDINVSLDIRKSPGGKNRVYRIVLSSEDEILSADESVPHDTTADQEGVSTDTSVSQDIVPYEAYEEIAAGDKFSRVWMETADWEQPGFQESLLEYPCCKRAFVRGAFLTSGSINDPGKSYHFEITCRKMQGAEELCRILNEFGVYPKILERKNKFVVYLKESEAIVDVLNIINAPNALMKFENVRIIKEMKNSANRQYNCDSANINKMVRTARRQLDDITYIREHMGFEKLSPSLKEMAMIRLLHPEEPLKELGNYLDPPVGKSGVNHRLKKLGEIAEKLRSGQM